MLQSDLFAYSFGLPECPFSGTIADVVAHSQVIVVVFNFHVEDDPSIVFEVRGALRSVKAINLLMVESVHPFLCLIL